MTKREGIILTAFTGHLLCQFSDYHKFAEELLNRPIFTHEFTNEKLIAEIKKLVTPEATAILNNLT